MKWIRFSGYRFVVSALACAALLMVVVQRGVTAEQAEAEGKESGSALVSLLGETLVRADGEEVATKSLEGRMVALYFSALWCPPCRAFTPGLVEAYAEWKEKDLPIELVFVSFDRTKEAQAEYMTGYKMKWLAVPFEGTKRQQLGTRFSVRGIPALLVLDAEGRLVTRTGVQEVGAHGAGALARWQAASEQE